MTKNLCKYEPCTRARYCKGYCRIHYNRERSGHPMWHGRLNPQRKVTAASAHLRIRNLWGPAKDYPCIECGETAAHWAYDGTDPTQHYGNWNGKKRAKRYIWYSLYPEFYMPMCAPCHRSRDASKAQGELRQYREWKYETGLTLEDFVYLKTEAEFDRLSSQAELSGECFSSPAGC